MDIPTSGTCHKQPDSLKNFPPAFERLPTYSLSDMDIFTNRSTCCYLEAYATYIAGSDIFQLAQCTAHAHAL